MDLYLKHFTPVKENLHQQKMEKSGAVFSLCDCHGFFSLSQDAPTSGRKRRHGQDSSQDEDDTPSKRFKGTEDMDLDSSHTGRELFYAFIDFVPIFFATMDLISICIYSYI